MAFHYQPDSLQQFFPAAIFKQVSVGAVLFRLLYQMIFIIGFALNKIYSLFNKIPVAK